MYNMFKPGSPYNNGVDPHFESMQPDPNAVTVAPENPLAVDETRQKRHRAMIAALQNANNSQDQAYSNPWAGGIQALGNIGAAGIKSYYGGA